MIYIYVFSVRQIIADIVWIEFRMMDMIKKTRECIVCVFKILKLKSTAISVETFDTFSISVDSRSI